MASYADCLDGTFENLQPNPDRFTCARVLDRDWIFYQNITHNGKTKIIYFNDLPKIIPDTEGTHGDFVSGDAVGRECISSGNCTPWQLSSKKNPLQIVQKYPSIQTRDGWELDSCFPGLSTTKNFNPNIIIPYWLENYPRGAKIIPLVLLTAFLSGVYIASIQRKKQ